jgi:hypothetical protein
MLKLRSFFIIGYSLAVFILFTACDNAPEPKTRFEFATGQNLTTTNRSVTGGEIIFTSLYARTASSGNKFKKFTISCDYDSSGTPTIYLDSTLNVSDFGIFYTFGTRGLTGTENWTFSIKDDRDSVYTKKFTLTTTSANKNSPFYTFTSLFYKQSAFRSLQYFSAQDGMVYPGYLALHEPALKPKINFFFDTENPQAIYPKVQTAPGSSTTFQATALTPKEFNDITNVPALTEKYNLNNPGATSLNNLKKGQVVAFKTTANKIGLILLDSMQVLTNQEDNTKYYRMPYTVKVEKPQ